MPDTATDRDTWVRRHPFAAMTPMVPRVRVLGL